MLYGVERASSEERRSRRLAWVESIFAAVPVVPFGVEVARTHAMIWAGLEAVGGRIGSHDLLVAATAVTYGYDVLTLNVAEFSRVPGLTVVRPDW